MTLLGAPGVNDEQGLIAAAPGFDGLGWAETDQLGSTRLDDQPLLGNDAKTAPDTRQSDVASHYFVQDPGISSALIYNLAHGGRSCPPGGNCGGDLLAISDQPCLTCLRNDFPTWLFKDGNVIVQMKQGLAVDETANLDSTLVTMLQDPTQLIVPVSEPVGILRAQGDVARAYSVDRQTLDATGAVFAFRDGVVGINYQFIDYDPPPTHVLAASAMQRKVYGIASGASGEELIIIPALPPVIGLTPPPPTVVPLWGADATGTPLALTYRAQDAKLYLLDRVAQHGRSVRLRLLRITPAGGYATLLGSTPDFRAGSTTYLSATASGDLLLARSKDPGSTLFMTLRPTKDSVELAGSLVQQGALMAPPDARMLPGFSVVMRHRATGPIQALEIPWSYLAAPGKAGQLLPQWE